MSIMKIARSTVWSVDDLEETDYSVDRILTKTEGIADIIEQKKSIYCRG